MNNARHWRLSRRIGSFAWDLRVIGLMILAGLALAAWAWLHDHPEHNPWAPLDLDDPPGWATARKIADLRNEPRECRAVLKRSGVDFRVLDPAGAGACGRDDRTVLEGGVLAPADVATTCAIPAGFEVWLRHSVEPAAEELLGSPLARVEHYGAFSCRRLYGRENGAWSEHATGNAIDVAAFVLKDGTRVSVLSDWGGDNAKAQFLHRVRDSACGVFGTVLSPEYNQAHANHFHLDQEARPWSVCR